MWQGFCHSPQQGRWGLPEIQQEVQIVLNLLLLDFSGSIGVVIRHLFLKREKSINETPGWIAVAEMKDCDEEIKSIY